MSSWSSSIKSSAMSIKMPNNTIYNIIGVYRPHSDPIQDFIDVLEVLNEEIPNVTGNRVIVTDDLNINLLLPDEIAKFILQFYVISYFCIR